MRASMFTWLVTAIGSVLVATLMPWTPARAADAVFTVHLDPDGCTEIVAGCSGRSPEQAVSTVELAQQVIRLGDPRSDVEVRIAPGTYVNRGTVWTTYVAGHTVSFLPDGYDPANPSQVPRPIFRGPEEPNASTLWLNVTLPDDGWTGPTSLRFHHLQIENYSTYGILFHGGTHQEGGFILPDSDGVNGNRIESMVFRQIGDRYSPAGVGYGAVDMVNSSDNVIIDNVFEDLENVSQPSLIHGVYLAHFSSRNTVRSNKFRNVSGAPVAVRNDANDNVITRNSFVRAGHRAHVQEWFEEQDEDGMECASHGNKFSENILGAGFLGDDIAEIYFYNRNGDQNYAGIGERCDNEGQPRMITAGNHLHPACLAKRARCDRGRG